MTVIINSPYAGSPVGSVLELDNATEAALVAQGRAVYSGASPGPVFAPFTPAEVQNMRDTQPSLQSLVSTPGIGAKSLLDPTRPKGGLGTLIADWSVGLTGLTSSADVHPEPSVPAGVVAQLTNASLNVYCTANAGAQSSTMNTAGFWARAAARPGAQTSYVLTFELGVDATFAVTAFCGFAVRADGKWRFHVLPPQVAWGTTGGFIIGTTNFGFVRVRESASQVTNTARTALQATETIQFGSVYRDPAAKPFAYVRLDDGVTDQYVARQTLATPFVGTSGVTIPASTPQSALSLVQAFGLKATCYVLTRHVGQPGGFLTVSQLRDLQDTYGWAVGFQTHANPVSADNRGLRLMGPEGFNIMPIGQISAVNTGTGVITSATHNITTITGVAGEQGYPVTLIGANFPTPTSGAALSVGDTLWLRNVTTTTFTAHRTETDSVNNTNVITYSAAGTAANWGYRYRGSANDSTAIAADFAMGQALMQSWGFNAWRHYAPNQGAFDVNTEAPIVALRAAGSLLTCSGTYGNLGITQNSYFPRIAIGHISAGIGAVATTPQGTSTPEWFNLPTAIDTHAGGVDAQTTIRTYVDDLIKRGGIGGNYHHHFSNEASMRNFCAYLDQVKLRVDQGVLSTGTIVDLHNSLIASGTAS